MPANKWNTLRVELTGKLATVFFNGKQLFQMEDETFKDTSAIGLWSKADCVTLFDNLSYGAK